MFIIINNEKNGASHCETEKELTDWFVYTRFTQAYIDKNIKVYEVKREVKINTECVVKVTTS